MENIVFKISQLANNIIKNTAFNILAVVCIAVLFLCSANIAQANFNFMPSDFTVAAPSHPPTGSYLPQGGTSYRLTSASPQHRTAMWHKNSLSMEQEWVFNFSIAFGNASTPTIGSGIAFVMYPSTETHNKATLIGPAGGYLGVPEYDNFFRIEFDTEHNNSPPEGFIGAVLPNGGNYHTAYMRGGNPVYGSSGISGYPLEWGYDHGPMQKGWRSVRGKELCVSIHWKFVNGVDNSDGYHLITYIMENDDNPDNPDREKMLPRLMVRFTDLDDFISGLSLAGSVNFGITSSTGDNPNTQSIEFFDLHTGSAAKPYIPVDINFVTSDITGKTLRRYSLYKDIPRCGANLPRFPFPQHILPYNRVICIDDGDSYDIEIINADMEGFIWKIGNTQVNATSINGTKWVLNLNEHSDLYEDLFNDNSPVPIPITVTAVNSSTGKTLTFEFKISQDIHNNRIYEAFANHLNQFDDISVDGQVGTLTITDNELSQSITLPKTDCHKLEYDKNQFDGKIVLKRSSDDPDLDILEFQLRENVCHATVLLSFNCEGCPGEFTFEIYNAPVPTIRAIPDCEGNVTLIAELSIDCEEVEIEDMKWSHNNENTHFIKVLDAEIGTTYEFKYTLNNGKSGSISKTLESNDMEFNFWSGTNLAEDNSLENFTVHPNGKTGIFVIENNGNTSETIKISLPPLPAGCQYRVEFDDNAVNTAYFNHIEILPDIIDGELVFVIDPTWLGLVSFSIRYFCDDEEDDTVLNLLYP